MDKYIPDDQRQQGIALAREMGQKEVTALAEANGRPFEMPVLRERAPSLATATLPPAPDAEKPAAPRSSPKVKPEAPKAIATAQAPKPAGKIKDSRAEVPKAVTSGSWRVQLGAFSEEARARALWSSLRGKVPGLSAYQLFLVKGGAVTKLQAGPLASNAEASRLCGAIKAAGSDCMPRKM